MEELRQPPSSYVFLRAGDASAGSGCTSVILSVDVNAFKKGNAEVRGLTSMSIGITSVGYTVTLTDQSQRVVFETRMASKHWLDTQSLDLAHQVAGKISKRLNKEMKSTSLTHYIQPGKRTQNAHVESFNGRLRD
jgi:hypothetical protein